MHTGNPPLLPLLSLVVGILLAVTVTPMPEAAAAAGHAQVEPAQDKMLTRRGSR